MGRGRPQGSPPFPSSSRVPTNQPRFYRIHVIGIMGERAAGDDTPGNPAFGVRHVLEAVWVVQFFVGERPRFLQELVVCLALLGEDVAQGSVAVELVDGL